MLRLMLANLLRRPARVVLTVAAVALGVALVVSTTSGYASVERGVRAFIDDFLGSDDLRVTHATDAGLIPAAYIETLRRDPAVARAYGRLAENRQFRTAAGELLAGPFEVLGVDPRADGYLGRLPLDAGAAFTRPDEDAVLIDVAGRRALGLDVGDTLNFPTASGPVPLRIVGVVYRPQILSVLGSRTLYVPLATLQRLTRADDPDRLTTVNAELVVGADIEATAERLQAGLQRDGLAWQVRSVRGDREVVDRGLRGVGLLALMGGMVSLLASTFIVFGTLSMGVAERQRTLAMLRAVGATRFQVARLVVYEGLALAVLGIVVGVPLGLLFVWGLTRYYADVFTGGLAVGHLGLAAAVAGTGLAAVAASLVPAYAAARVDPLSAMRPAADNARSGPPWAWGVAGLLLLLIDVALLWPPLGYLPLPEGWERAGRFWLHFVVGLPTLFFGFFLVAPMLVWLADRLLAGVTARVAGVTPALLRHQLGGGVWRAAGTAAALMVGPAVLIVMNTQGRSGIGGWQLPDAFPDVFLFDRNGIPADRVARLADVPGIRRLADGSPDVTPIGYLHPRLGEGIFAIAGAAFAPDRTMFVAVEPDRVFEMMDLEFTAGDRDTARRMLSRGVRATLADGTEMHGTLEVEGFLTLDGRLLRHGAVVATREHPYLLVTQEFRQLRGFGPGDVFLLKRNRPGLLGRLRSEDVAFTVAGVVRSPGIDLMVGTFDLGRQFEGQSAASVFGTIDDARELFGMRDVFLIAANLEAGIERADLLPRVAAALNNEGVSLSDVRQLKIDIQEGLRGLLAVAGVVAWAALAVSSFGVTNTVMAGVRTRRYQFGVLRAIGVTRGEMLRLIVAEAVLLGVAAAVLGTSAGLLMSLNARRLQSWTLGYVPPLQVAWDVIALGAVAVLTVSVLAALWPARSASREPVLDLLRGGRASA